MRIHNYPSDILTGTEQFLASNFNTVTQEYETVNFTVDTLKTFLVGTDDTSEFTNITLGESLKFEGATADSHETSLKVVDPTQDRTVNLPNASGFVAMFLTDPGEVTITSTPAELNVLDGYTGSVTELNYLDTLHATGVTATEFDYLDGVTSNIQTQLDAKIGSANLSNYLDVTSTSSKNLQGFYTINGFPLTLSAAPASAAAGDLVLRHNVESTGEVVKVIAWKNTHAEGSDDGIAKIIGLTSSTGSTPNLGGRLQFKTRQKASANYNTIDFDSDGLLTVPSGLTITTGNITLGSTAITAIGEELNILDANVGNTAAASDMATSSGAFTSNSYKISHTLTLNGSFADDAELADIVVTNNKVLATSVVLANSSAPCQVDVHAVAAGSFRVRVKNISGAGLADDSTMVINYRVI
jgi:hypothetical protein